MQGILAPVLTPFDSQLNPDPGRFVSFCRKLLDDGCTGLVPFGASVFFGCASYAVAFALLRGPANEFLRTATPDEAIQIARLLQGTWLGLGSATARHFSLA